MLPHALLTSNKISKHRETKFGMDIATIGLGEICDSYVVLSTIALTLVNNSPLDLDNMWVVYLPMFITVYVFSRWLDSRFNQS